jgi:hypothetical protein
LLHRGAFLAHIRLLFASSLPDDETLFVTTQTNIREETHLAVSVHGSLATETSMEVMAAKQTGKLLSTGEFYRKSTFSHTATDLATESQGNDERRYTF